MYRTIGGPELRQQAIEVIPTFRSRSVLKVRVVRSSRVLYAPIRRCAASHATTSVTSPSASGLAGHVATPNLGRPMDGSPTITSVRRCWLLTSARYEPSTMDRLARLRGRSRRGRKSN